MNAHSNVTGHHYTLNRSVLNALSSIGSGHVAAAVYETGRSRLFEEVCLCGGLGNNEYTNITIEENRRLFIYLTHRTK